MVGFGTDGVDLTSHLLQDEAEFLALGCLVVQGFKKIIAVFPEPDLFFCDIQLFKVIDQLLFKTVFNYKLTTNKVFDF